MDKYIKIMMDNYSSLYIIVNEKDMEEIQSISDKTRDDVYFGKYGACQKEDFKRIVKEELTRNGIEYKEFTITEV